MTRNSDLDFIGADAAATRETLKDGLTRTIGVARIKAVFAGAAGTSRSGAPALPPSPCSLLVLG